MNAINQDWTQSLNPDLGRFMDYWQSKCPAPDAIPAMADIEMMDLWQVADRLILGDIIRSSGRPDRYLWRYCGSTLCDVWGMELTGKYLDDTHDEQTTRDTNICYAAIQDSRRPHFWSRVAGVKDDDRSYLSYQRIMAPLTGGDGATVDHLFGCYVFESARVDKEELTGQPIETAITTPTKPRPKF